MTETNHSEVIFRGSKFFWRTRNNIDVTIVNHNDSATTEVIVYEPALDVEADRIYLNSDILHSKLNHAEIEAKFSFAKQNNVPHTAQFEADVMSRAISDYVLNHLFIKEYSKEDKHISVQLQIESVVLDVSADGLVCPKPEELSSHVIKHFKLYSGDEINEAQQALETAKNNLEAQCAKAMEMEAEVHGPLSGKERWRIPIMLGKLAKNKTLNDSDSKIWTAVSSKLKAQEDVDRLTTTALRLELPPRTPTHSGSRGLHLGRAPSTNHIQLINRSSSATPESTPRLASTSRANSQRFFNSTASSHSRALSIAEEDSPSHPTPRKQLKRANSKGVATKAPRKTSKRIASKRVLTDADPILPEEALDTNGADNSADKAVSLVGQIGERMSTFASTLSAKLGARSITNTTEAAVTDCEPTTTTPGEKADGGEATDLEDLNGLDGATSESTPHLMGAFADTIDNGTVSRQTSLNHVEGAVRGKPAKRRTYFGSFLAPFMGAGKSDSSLPMMAKEASSCSISGVEEPLVALTLSHKQGSKKLVNGRNPLQAALSGWLPWKHSAAVVPADATASHLPAE